MIMEFEKIRLRKTQKEDVDFVLTAENQEENRPYVNQWPKEQHMEALENSDIFHGILEDTLTGERVGYTIIAGLQGRHHSIELMRLVVGPKGKGYGRAFFKAGQEVGFL